MTDSTNGESKKAAGPEKWTDKWLLSKPAAATKQASITLRMRTTIESKALHESRITTFLDEVLKCKAYMLQAELDALKATEGTEDADSESDDEGTEEDDDFNEYADESMRSKKDHTCTPLDLAEGYLEPTHGVHFHLFITASRYWLNKNVGKHGCFKSVCQIFDFLSDHIDDDAFWAHLATKPEPGQPKRYVNVFEGVADSEDDPGNDNTGTKSVNSVTLSANSVWKLHAGYCCKYHGLPYEVQRKGIYLKATPSQWFQGFRMQAEKQKLQREAGKLELEQELKTGMHVTDGTVASLEEVLRQKLADLMTSSPPRLYMSRGVVTASEAEIGHLLGGRDAQIRQYYSRLSSTKRKEIISSVSCLVYTPPEVKPMDEEELYKWQYRPKRPRRTLGR